MVVSKQLQSPFIGLQKFSERGKGPCIEINIYTKKRGYIQRDVYIKGGGGVISGEELKSTGDLYADNEFIQRGSEISGGGLNPEKSIYI